MNDIQRGVIILIKSAITGQAMELPEGFSMEKAFPLIKEHQLIPIAYEGAIQCGVSNKTLIMRQMFQAYYQCVLYSEAQMKMVGRIFEAFERDEIDYMPLKGCNMKMLYPKPELRQMGDADILIRMDQYDRIKPIVKELGFEEKYESDHELVWHSNSLHLELHKCLVSSVNEDYYAFFGDGWQLGRKKDNHRYAMLQEDEFVYLFNHFARHYREGGIGCRHIVDLWVYRRAYSEMDEEHILNALEKLRLREFYENTRSLLQFWFEEGEGNDKTEFMTAFIFSSGSWGRKENHILSAELRNAKSAGSLRGGKRKTVLESVFPTAPQIAHLYPVLWKKPWLLPAIWPARWADILLFRRDRIHKKRAAIELAKEEQVEAYQQSLYYVGLDYNLEK